MQRAAPGVGLCPACSDALLRGARAPIRIQAGPSGGPGAGPPSACGEPQRIAALPHQSMKHLIWVYRLKKMKYDLVATALQHPSPSRPSGMMNKHSKLPLRTIITGNMAQPLPATSITPRSTQWPLS